MVSGSLGETGGRALASVDRIRHGVSRVAHSGSNVLNPHHSHASAIAAGMPGSPLGGAPSIRRRATSPQQRRRSVLIILGGASLASLSLAFVTDSTLIWLVALGVVTLFALFVVAVVNLEQAKRERSEKVRYLPVIEAPTRRVEPPEEARRTFAQPG
ncbi:MAG: hypothetical protein F2894_02985 [Actinobacteria bacterium]|uniref:Unannotated protein n=1 Tax=freshwater metagenome TaxID=449393 RepID=A0A6J7PWY7_9ZZZZ|nr:hypothetical protein [Actinomycetota bacterium]MSY05735.1 hypothetical protein [Actinomycetota bacterium]MSZ29017.1 hypothetical protein [Actinomycetota bacterium]